MLKRFDKTAVAVVERVVVGGGHDVEAVLPDLIKDERTRAEPASAGYRVAVAFKIVYGGFEIHETHVTACDLLTKGVKALVAVFGDVTEDHRVTGGGKGHF